MEGLDMGALAVLFAVPPMAVDSPTEVVPVPATPGGGDQRFAAPGVVPAAGEWWFCSVEPYSEGDERNPEDECPAVCHLSPFSLTKL